MAWSGVAMSAMFTVGRTWLVPGNPRMVRTIHRRPIHPNLSFHVCELSKPHVASIAIGLSVITLLLVIFAYHGGYGLFVVSVGLAFIVFGPLLVCKILMHAYYRQMHMDARSIRQRQAESQIQTDAQPQVFACIIIAPQTSPAHFEAPIDLSDLPTYDEAICIEAADQYGVQNNNCSLVRNKNNFVCQNANNELFTAEDVEISPLTPNSTDRCTVVDETPPPSYTDALAAMTGNRENREIVETEYLLNGTNVNNEKET